MLEFGIALSLFPLDGVRALGVGLWARGPDFAVLDFGIAFSSLSLDGVSG